MPTPGQRARISRPRAGPRRCASAACGCRRSRRQAGARRRARAARRRRSRARPPRSRPRQQPREPLAQQHRVVGQDYAHGISACTTVPRPRGLSTYSRPPSASTRSASPRRPLPPASPAPADAVVGDLHDRPPVDALHADTHRGRLGVLDDVGQRLGYDVVGGGLDALGEPLGQRDVDVERQPRSVGELLERGAEAALREDAGVDALGELAQLAQRVGERGARLGEQRLRRRVALDPRVREPERHRDRHEPLLRAVVQIALDPPPLDLRCLDDAGARRAQLLEPRSACSRSLSSARPAAAPADATSSGSSASAGSWTSAAIRRPSRSTVGHRPVIGQLHRAAIGIDVAVAQPVGDGQRRVAQRPGQRGAQRARLERAAKLDHEVRDRAARQPHAQQPDEERDRHGRERELQRDVGQLGQRLPERVVERPRDHQGERGRAGDEDGRDREPAARRRRAPAPRDHQDRRDRERRGEQLLHVHDRLGRRGRAGDLEHVVGARAAPVVAVAEQQPCELHRPDDQRGRCQHRTLGHRVQAAVGERHQQEPDTEQVGRLEQLPERPRQRVRGPDQLVREPGQAGRDHHLAGHVLRPPLPRDQPAADERPADQQRDRDLGAARRIVRRSRHQRRRADARGQGRGHQG